MAEQLITWVTEVSPDPADPDRLQRVRDVLATIEADPGRNACLPFAALPMVHFASFTLFDKESPALLVFESNIDKPFSLYVSRLVTVGRRALDDIYGGCPGYPHSGDEASVERFFKSKSLKRGAQLYHIGHPDRSVQEIRGDHELRRSIARELNSDPQLRKLSPADIVREIRRRANCPSRFWPWHRPWNSAWNEEPGGEPTPLDEIRWNRENCAWLGWFGRFVSLVLIAWLVATALVVVGNAVTIPRNAIIVLEALGVFAAVRFGSGNASLGRSAILAVAFGLLVALPFRWPLFANFSTRLLIPSLLVLVLPGVLLLSFLWLLWRLMVSERRWIPLDQSTRQQVRTLLEAEDLPEHSHYNHVAALSELWPDFRQLRCARTWLVLQLLNLFYRTQYVKGKLVTIPSIHFAQWSLVNGRYLLFLTNYDGPADSYLDDFFNSLALGVAFIWHDTKPFPMSIDPRRLKVWVRKGQTLARVRYRAAVYDGLTVGAINSNTYIRNRLLRGRGEASARRWLRRFATIPEEPSVLSRLSGWVKERAGVSG